MKFNLCILRPEGYVHVAAFDELVELLIHSLTDLGHQVSRQFNGIESDAINLLLGCHLAHPDMIPGFPRNSIVINTEQISHDRSEWADTVFKWASRFEVWDYNARNIDAFRQRGITRTRLLRLGFHPKLVRIPKAPEQDIDVLFYGTMFERRLHILNQLKDNGLAVHAVFGVYGKARDELIARSKIVLNMHHYQSRIFEVVRVFYLMTNSKAVVSEVNVDTAIDPIYLPGICAAPYEGLVEACRALVDDEIRRSQLERDALATISALPQADFTRAMLPV